MIIRDFYNAIDTIAPFSIAGSWDNVGLLVGAMEDSVSGALLALDVTKKVIDEAVEQNTNLIITHHPLIFTPIKALSSDSLVYRLVKEGIGLISAHTNLDMTVGGVNDTLAKMLNIRNIKQVSLESSKPYFLVEITTSEMDYKNIKAKLTEDTTIKALATYVATSIMVPPTKLNYVLSLLGEFENTSIQGISENYAQKEAYGYASVGDLWKEMTPKELALHVKEILKAPGIRYIEGTRPIKRVAFCGGSGSKFVTDSICAGADAYITGELPHDKLLEAVDAGITIIMAGHFHTETIIMEPLKENLLQYLPMASIVVSQQCTDGVQYL